LTIARLIKFAAVFAALSLPLAAPAQQSDSAEAAATPTDRAGDAPDAFSVPTAPPPGLPVSSEEKARPGVAPLGAQPQEAGRGLR
jgi:hypothetical protein